MNKISKPQYYLKLIGTSLLFSVLLFCKNTLAMGIKVDKISLSITASQPVDTVQITNVADQTDAPLYLQANAFSWTQQNGQTTLVPTTDLILSPPFMKVLPEKSQTFRVGLRKPLPAITREIAYRLNIRQTNPFPSKSKNKVSLLIAVSLPFFVEPDQPIYQATFSARQAGGARYIRISNQGNIHLYCTKLTLTNDQGKTVADIKPGMTVLPGAYIDVPVATKSIPKGNYQVMMEANNTPPLNGTITLSS